MVGGLTYDYGYAGMMGNPTATSVGNRWHKDVLKAWSPENPSSTIPRWYFNDLNTTGSSDRFLIDGSYLNLQNIQVGYTLPDSWTSHLKIKIYVYILFAIMYTIGQKEKAWILAVPFQE